MRHKYGGVAVMADYSVTSGAYYNSLLANVKTPRRGGGASLPALLRGARTRGQTLD